MGYAGPFNVLVYHIWYWTKKTWANMLSEKSNIRSRFQLDVLQAVASITSTRKYQAAQLEELKAVVGTYHPLG